jgi:hypothetical protein
MPTCGACGAGRSSIATLGGGGSEAMLEETTAGAGGVGAFSFREASSVATTGATGIKWLVALFSGRFASSSRTRRIS